LIEDIKSHASHGKRAIDSKGEYMGSIAHEEVANFDHNNQELKGLML
jgi:hypothetical protein